MIYEVNGRFVISSHGCWLPGNYNSRATARHAFQFPNDVLQALQDRINNVQGENRPITMDDLRAATQTSP